MILGVFGLAQFATDLIDYFNQVAEEKWKEERLKQALISPAQLLEFDQNDDGKIDKFEFLSKMLVETNECTDDKVQEIMDMATVIFTETLVAIKSVAF